MSQQFDNREEKKNTVASVTGDIVAVPVDVAGDVVWGVTGLVLKTPGAFVGGLVSIFNKEKGKEILEDNSKGVDKVTGFFDDVTDGVGNLPKAALVGVESSVVKSYKDASDYENAVDENPTGTEAGQVANKIVNKPLGAIGVGLGTVVGAVVRVPGEIIGESVGIVDKDSGEKITEVNDVPGRIASAGTSAVPRTIGDIGGRALQAGVDPIAEAATKNADDVARVTKKTSQPGTSKKFNGFPDSKIEESIALEDGTTMPTNSAGQASPWTFPKFETDYTHKIYNTNGTLNSDGVKLINSVAPKRLQITSGRESLEDVERAIKHFQGNYDGGLIASTGRMDMRTFDLMTAQAATRKSLPAAPPPAASTVTAPAENPKASAPQVEAEVEVPVEEPKPQESTRTSTPTEAVPTATPTTTPTQEVKPTETPTVEKAVQPEEKEYPFVRENLWHSNATSSISRPRLHGDLLEWNPQVHGENMSVKINVAETGKYNLETTLTSNGVGGGIEIHYLKNGEAENWDITPVPIPDSKKPFTLILGGLELPAGENMFFIRFAKESPGGEPVSFTLKPFKLTKQK